MVRFPKRRFTGSIEATRQSVKLRPAEPIAQFKLGLALLGRGDVVASEAAYKRGVSVVKRQSQADARQKLESALGDFKLLPSLEGTAKVAATRIRSRLSAARDQIGGWSVGQDYAKAREWYKKAADKGNARAMFNLGTLYTNGEGIALAASLNPTWPSCRFVAPGRRSAARRRLSLA